MKEWMITISKFQQQEAIKKTLLNPKSISVKNLTKKTKNKVGKEPIKILKKKFKKNVLLSFFF